MSSIKEHLRNFKLSGISNTLEERLSYAEKNWLSNTFSVKFEIFSPDVCFLKVFQNFSSSQPILC